jgi:hypothetical protein
MALALAASCLVAIASPAPAQGARILRPSTIADSSRTLQLEPAFAGFRIGEPAPGAIERLGAPLTVDTLGTGFSAPRSYANLATGINLIVTDVEGVGIILVTHREAGPLDSIRVGDLRTTVLARWGPPAAGGEAGGLWLAGDYVVAVSFDEEGRVARLGIGLGQEPIGSAT